jgi:hypothetical protein
MECKRGTPSRTYTCEKIQWQQRETPLFNYSEADIVDINPLNEYCHEDVLVELNSLETSGICSLKGARTI